MNQPDALAVLVAQIMSSGEAAADLADQVDGDGQGHAAFEQVGELLSKGGEFLKLRFALAAKYSADWFR